VLAQAGLTKITILCPKAYLSKVVRTLYGRERLGDTCSYPRTTGETCPFALPIPAWNELLRRLSVSDLALLQPHLDFVQLPSRTCLESAKSPN
jgi:hypothetical protein